MEALVQSFILVFISEMGDKTQLLALLLIAKFKRPAPILTGIFLATILNHGLATYVGLTVSELISPQTLKWILSFTFIGFGLWILKPDKEEPIKEKVGWGPFMTTLVAFFFAEMGDKTQLATVALGAQFNSMSAVTIGTTLGMMGSNGLAIFFGQRFLEKVPMKWLHRIASFLFILFGLLILFGF